MAELIPQNQLPLPQILGSDFQFCLYVPANQQHLPQLQVITGQKFTFLDSAEAPIA
jgi:hypothetical protein